MSDLLDIGRTLGSLTTTSQQHSQRLGSLEADVSSIKQELQAWASLVRRAALVLALWGIGTTAGIASPQIGEVIGPAVKQIVLHVLTKL